MRSSKQILLLFFAGLATLVSADWYNNVPVPGKRPQFKTGQLKNGIDFETALSSLYGVDLMQDNVDLCRDRLLCGQEHLRHIVEKNIVQGNALECNYTFGETEVFGNGLFETVD